MHVIEFPNLLTESNFLWFMQTLLGGVLVYAGISRTVLHRHAEAAGTGGFVFDCDDLPCWLASLMSVLEIVGGLCLLVPAGFWSQVFYVQLVAGAMALLMVCIAIHHMRRRGPAAPVIAVFLLAVFIIVGYSR